VDSEVQRCRARLEILSRKVKVSFTSFEMFKTGNIFTRKVPETIHRINFQCRSATFSKSVQEKSINLSLNCFASSSMRLRLQPFQGDNDATSSFANLSKVFSTKKPSLCTQRTIGTSLGDLDKFGQIVKTQSSSLSNSCTKPLQTRAKISRILGSLKAKNCAICSTSQFLPSVVQSWSEFHPIDKHHARFVCSISKPIHFRNLRIQTRSCSTSGFSSADARYVSNGVLTIFHFGFIVLAGVVMLVTAVVFINVLFWPTKKRMMYLHCVDIVAADPEVKKLLGEPVKPYGILALSGFGAPAAIISNDFARLEDEAACFHVTFPVKGADHPGKVTVDLEKLSNGSLQIFNLSVEELEVHHPHQKEKVPTSNKKIVLVGK